MRNAISGLPTCIGQGYLIGRERELETLSTILASNGPRVIHISGITGIGKTTLLEMFSERVKPESAFLLKLDCRSIEPTEKGLTQALEQRVNARQLALKNLLIKLGELAPQVILALDSYEVFRLLDTWLRQEFIPSLPDNVRVYLLSREPPQPIWLISQDWQESFHAIQVTPITDEDSYTLLTRMGVTSSAAKRVGRSVHGHPLALRLIASAFQARPDIHLDQMNLQQVLQTLAEMFLADISDPVIRQALEASAVVRRTTASLLRAIFPTIDPDLTYVRLSGLPFIDIHNDGLLMHDAVREAIATSLRARDPATFVAYRRKAWQQLADEVNVVGRGELWRYTADMLYLIENPVIHEAFFPSGGIQLAVEPARLTDFGRIGGIISSHEGKEASEILISWLSHTPQCFSAVRNSDDRIIGFYCKMLLNQVITERLKADPITGKWLNHLKSHPLPKDQTVLFCRRWLSHETGEAPSDVQAAAWLDLKRTYMEMRPKLRRIYLTVYDLPAYAPVALHLGFQVLPECEVSLDGHTYHTAMLDFGPMSVDGWLSNLAAAELGIKKEDSLLDNDAHDLLLGSERVHLTPLEYRLLRHLQIQQGKAVSRSELLNEVWGTQYQGGSNVVDSVVRGLRKKLGNRSAIIETVTGVGYRYNA